MSTPIRLTDLWAVPSLVKDVRRRNQALSKLATANVKLMVLCSMLISNAFSAFRSFIHRFWCHFDDDNYVNIPTLVKSLNEYHAYQDWYLGKPSISSPIEMFLNPVSLVI